MPDGRDLPRSLFVGRHAGLVEADRHLRRQRHFSIDGHVENWFTDDTPKRFEAYGWRVIRAVDGHDTARDRGGLEAGLQAGDRPTLVCCKTVIGKGSPNKADTHDVHGAALGAAEVAATRAALGWTHAHSWCPRRFAPHGMPGRPAPSGKPTGRGGSPLTHGVSGSCRRVRTPGGDAPVAGRLANPGRRAPLAKVVGGRATIASRKASQNAIEALQPSLPEMLGGSADLTGSNLTEGKDMARCARRRWRQLHQLRGARVRHERRDERHRAARRICGVRRHLSDVLRLQPQCRAHGRADARRVIYVFTHDSIGLGEDGPPTSPSSMSRACD